MIFLTHPPQARALYYGDRALAALRELGAVRLNETDAVLEGAALEAAATDMRVIVADRAVPGPAALFAALPELVAFVRCAVDVRTVDIPAATAAGVLVTQATPGFAAAVSELILGVMVDLHRHVSVAVAEYRAATQPPVRMGREIRGSTVGIIGFGTIGRTLAPVLLALGATVVAADPHAVTSMPGVQMVPLDTLLGVADTVVCLATATPGTVDLLDAAALARMKRGAFLVNMSRGELVDEAALVAALDAGHLAGAALDVGRAPDQMPSVHLARRADVIATPHTGGLTVPAAEHQAMETVHQVSAILRGKVPPGSLNAAGAFRLCHLAR